MLMHVSGQVHSTALNISKQLPPFDSPLVLMQMLS